MELTITARRILRAYQCYAVDEPVDIATRAERQKRKITTDLAKLIANHADIMKLFLGVRHQTLGVDRASSR